MRTIFQMIALFNIILHMIYVIGNHHYLLRCQILHQGSKMTASQCDFGQHLTCDIDSRAASE